MTSSKDTGELRFRNRWLTGRDLLILLVKEYWGLLFGTDGLATVCLADSVKGGGQLDGGHKFKLGCQISLR